MGGGNLPCFWIFNHNWSEWDEPFTKGVYWYQRRVCLKCHRVQERKVR